MDDKQKDLNPESGKNTSKWEEANIKRKWTNQQNSDNDYWESRIFGALTFIVIGLIFLLNTTGILEWSVWLSIFRYWPLFIVSAGISIIFNGSRLLKFFGGLITFALFIVIVSLAVINPLSIKSNINLPFTIATNTNVRNETYSIKSDEYSDVTKQDYNINLPLGNFKLSDLSSQDFLKIESSFYGDYQKPIVNKEIDDETLKINITTGNQNNFVGIPQGPSYELGMGQDSVPADLNLKFGAGNSELKLSDQLINNLIAEVGAGNIVLELSEDSIPKDSFNVKNGIGNITITLPEDLAFKINYKVGLGNISLNEERISSGTGNSSFIAGSQSTSEKKITINIEVGLGNVEIFTK